MFSRSNAVMDSGEHEHRYIFNDDGFEVCDLCGICTSQREQQHNYSYENKQLTNSAFADILINNNLGYVELVEEEYLKLKTVLHRGYSNKALYAYCTYKVLLKDNVYYSLKQIADMFHIYNFSKLFCQIENNKKVESKYFNIREEKYIESALQLFLSEQNLKFALARALEFSRIIKKIHKPLKPNFLSSVSLYFALKDTFKCLLLLQQELSSYFSINIRTFKSVVREAAQSLSQQ